MYLQTKNWAWSNKSFCKIVVIYHLHNTGYSAMCYSTFIMLKTIHILLQKHILVTAEAPTSWLLNLPRSTQKRFVRYMWLPKSVIDVSLHGILKLIFNKTVSANVELWLLFGLPRLFHVPRNSCTCVSLFRSYFYYFFWIHACLSLSND